ncbi:hypothetical protein EDD69_106205 [Thermolongibacillus altinsuensis]|uniref:Uncharacterized protein n=1 Tax=Thermolongibacillus altinsuensis TaxID=575256 RepID=A0A4R1QMJ4_9BACL|nr:hypothetical protein EDD69_106205 [Thermolongibacillus altinsuensis]
MIKNKIVVTIKPKNGSEIAAVLTFFEKSPPLMSEDGEF